MTYILEKITPEDQEKIIADAGCDQHKQNALREMKRRGMFSETWAIDRERNCYLISGPYLVPEDSWNRPFYAFVNGYMYRIRLEAAVGRKLYFDETTLPSEDLLADVQDEIRAAFGVYGSFGRGPLNEKGKPEYAIDPVFGAKPALNPKKEV